MTRVYVADFESDGLLEEATRIWCGSFKSIDGEHLISFYPGSHEDYIKEMLLFLDTVDTLIMHNGHGFDWILLEKLYGYKFKGEKIDTVVWSRLFQPKRQTPFNCPIKNRPHSLLVWGYRVGRGKVEHDDWSQYSPEMLIRCQEDVEIGHLVYIYLLEEGSHHNWDSAKWLTGRLFEILGKQTEYGWLVDRGWMDRCIYMCTHWMDRIDRALAPRLPVLAICEETKAKGVYNYVKKPYKKDGTLNANVIKWLDGVDLDIGGQYSRVSFRPLDPNSRVEAIEYLLDLGWIPKEWNFNKETKERTSPKLSKDDPFDGITDRVGKLFAKRMQIKHRRSNVEGLIKHIRSDGRIPSVVSNLAETGRATHKKIVNIPNGDAFFGKWMRKIFVVEEGKVLVGTDSAGCQLRMLAARMGDKDYMNVIVEGDKDKGTDVHSVNMRAAKLDNRGQAKTFIYGFLFGAGDAKIGKIVKGGPSEGKRLKEEFLKGLPALGALLKKITKEWRSTAETRKGKWGVEYYNGWIKGLDGRPIFIDSEHKILVYLLQSDEAIMMAAAYVFLYDWCEQEGWVWGKDWAYVSWYHDEYTAEVRPEIVDRFRYLAEMAIAEAGKYFHIACPHEGESAVGGSWYAIH